MKKLSLLHTILVAVLYVSGTLCALSQDWNQVLKLSGADRTNRSVAARGADYFGQALAMEGNYAVVAAPWDLHDAKGSNPLSMAGSVIVFEQAGGVWTQVKKLVANDRGAEDRFGESVAIYGTTIVVGAPNEDDDASGENPLNGAGSVYIFNKDQGGAGNWGQVAKLVAPDRAATDLFGASIGIFGEMVAVGAYLEDEDAAGVNRLEAAGAVYLFGKNTGGENHWGFIKKLVPADRSEYDGFGYSLSISSGLLVVGSYQDDRDANGLNSLANAGSVYIFAEDQGGAHNWGQVKKLVAPDRANDDKFGQAVCYRSGLLVVGAPYEDEDANWYNTLAQAGSAYVFSMGIGGPGNWNFMKKLVAGDRAADDQLGLSVSVSGNIIVLGAYGEDEDENGANTLSASGSAYIFSRDQGGVNNWGQLKKVAAPDRAATDQFGMAVAAAGNFILAGAPMQDLDFNGKNYLSGAGAVYFFEKDYPGNDNWGNRQKLVLQDLVADQYFGYAVAIDGDYGVVGARNDFGDETGEQHLMEAGAAWIIKNVKGVWTPVKKLVASDRNSFDHFGCSVAISNEFVVVGAFQEAEDANGANTMANAGSAYIFSKNQGGADHWGQVKKITAPQRAVGDVFGFSVAISGYTVIVGAYQEDEDAAEVSTVSNAGAAYVFYKDQGGSNNWGMAKKLVATDRAKDDQFGYAVGIDFNTIIIGMPSSDYGGSNSGAAYVFYKDQGGSNNWGQLKKLGAMDKAAFDFFGSAVAISGNSIAVGAYGEDEDASGANTLSGAGAAYIFYKDQDGLDNWGQVKKLVASDRARSDNLGYSVAIQGDYAFAGAWNRSEYSPNLSLQQQAGSAYFFMKDEGGINNWGQTKKLLASDGAAGDRFGSAIAISGNTLVVGAYQEDEDMIGKNGLSNAGSVYIFKGGCSSYPLAAESGMVLGGQGSNQTNYYNSNCSLIASIAPSGDNPITGCTMTKVWIFTAQPFNYVKRVYEITPALYPETATGRVTLYYNQAEFDAFNAVSSNYFKLPYGPSDATGIHKLRIEKRGGVSSEGSGSPYSYSGAIETINPDDNDIVWNAAENRWEVSFEVTGFSGFFVKTTPEILPIHWISFTGLVNKNGQAALTWMVQENDVNRYSVEKSPYGRAFAEIGFSRSVGDGKNSYHFTEYAPLKGDALFRIRETNRLNGYSYSPVILLKPDGKSLISLYPNPVKDKLQIGLGNAVEHTAVILTDMQGRLVRSVQMAGSTQTIDMSGLPAGVYVIRVGNGEAVKVVKE